MSEEIITNEAQPEEPTPTKRPRGNPNFTKRHAGGQKQASPETQHPQGIRPDRSKPKRVTLKERNIISYSNLDPDYVYRVVNDKPGKIDQAQKIGYELVESDEQIGDYGAAEGSKLGKAVSKAVGGGTKGYLMRIKKEFYEEDRAAKDKIIDATEQAMKPNKANGEYGPGVTND